ncbi:hypothetical protein C4577_01930 [Candidatus Parcubacteria bacterium]|nr:MAG: hypothetical protein C4577_01930 [Candidatus Parcubacteria bacterium]
MCVDIFSDILLNLNSGVYCFRNFTTGKRYIGSASVSFRNRFLGYKRSLRKGVCHNKLLQRAWNKYGELDFEIIVVEICSPENCIERETYWISFFNSANKKLGYNICPTGRNHLGTKLTSSHKRKIGKSNSVALLGKKDSLETKKRKSEASKGKPKTVSHKLNISKSLTGVNRDDKLSLLARMTLRLIANNPEITKPKLFADNFYWRYPGLWKSFNSCKYAFRKYFSRKELFRSGNYRLHSGEMSTYKIDCSVLADSDWNTLASLATNVLPKFGKVVSVPTGGDIFASCLEQYATKRDTDPILVVDDVLTTGRSMEEVRNSIVGSNTEGPNKVIGVVAFSRGNCPGWITPLFQFNYRDHQ